jgi:hypothetical protein
MRVRLSPGALKDNLFPGTVEDMQLYAKRKGEWKDDDNGPSTRYANLKSKKRRALRRIAHRHGRIEGQKTIIQERENES